MSEIKLHLAELFVRLFTGILFFFQGYDKVFKVKINGVIAVFNENAQQDHVPHFILVWMSYLTSFIELIGGVLLFLGLFNAWATTFLCVDLLLVSAAFSITKPMWDTKHVFARFVLLIFLLSIPEEWHHYSLDHYINFK